MGHQGSVGDDAGTQRPAAYFAIALLFLVCAIGFWAGGGDSGHVTLAVIGLALATVASAVRGVRMQQRLKVAVAVPQWVE